MRASRSPTGEAYETKLAKSDGYLEPGDRILEIGCGTGTTAIHHAPRVSRIVATDISRSMIGIATDKAREAGISNIDFRVCSVDDIAAEPGSFDVIMAHSILHLLADVPRVLTRLHALLKPGGLLISSTACIRDFFPAFRFVAPIGRAVGLLPRVNVFGETEFVAWLEEAGFVVEERWQPSPRSGVYIVARSINR